MSCVCKVHVGGWICVCLFSELLFFQGGFFLLATPCVSQHYRLLHLSLIVEQNIFYLVWIWFQIGKILWFIWVFWSRFSSEVATSTPIQWWWIEFLFVVFKAFYLKISKARNNSTYSSLLWIIYRAHCKKINRFDWIGTHPHHKILFVIWVKLPFNAIQISYLLFCQQWATFSNLVYS